MPTTLTSPNGTTFHIFQLPQAVKEASPGIGLEELGNDLGDSFISQRLYGSVTGNRFWQLSLAALDHSTSRTVTGPSGETLTWEEYIWALFVNTKRTGIPFVYNDIRTGQNYLVTFADKQLNYEKMLVRLYKTGLNIKQQRLDNETVYDVSLIPDIGSKGDQWFKAPAFSGSTWTADASISVGGNLTATGDVAKVSASQNGQDVVRLSGSAFTGLVSNSINRTLRECFIACKIREATFTSSSQLFKGSSSPSILLGTNGDTKFQSQSLGTTYEYRLNGVLYTEANQQAPMNKWGIIHLRYPTGWTTTGGRRFGIAKADIGEIFMCSALLPIDISFEITEYLTVKYAAGT